MLEVAAVPVLTDNYVWLIHNGDTGETAAVDPSVAEPVLDAVAAKGWSLTQVLNTHWHPDHTGGNAGIKAATGAPIIAPAEAARRDIRRIVVMNPNYAPEIRAYLDAAGWNATLAQERAGLP